MERWRSVSRVIKSKPSANRWNNRKMVPIYRLNLSKSKAVRNTFLDCVQYLTHETEKQRSSGKHHYDDSEIKALRLSCAIGRKGRNALALGKSFLNETDSLYESYTKYDYSWIIEQINIAYQNDEWELDSSVWNTLQRPLNAFNASSVHHLCRRWKSWFRNWEEGLLSKAWWLGLCILI